MKTLLCLGVAVLTAAPVPCLFAQQAANIMIDILEASDQPGSIDPALAYIREQIQRSPLRYQKYRTLASASRTIPLGQRDIVTFVVPEELTLELTPIKIDSRIIQLGVKLWQKRKIMLETNLSLARGGTVIIGGPSKPHSAIMIALSEGF